MDREAMLKYVRKKKRKKRVAIITGICSIAIAIFIIIAFNLLYVDRFTITIDNDPALCLTVDDNKQKMTTSLKAPPILEATDTQYSDIPEDIDEGLGSKNTNQYFAYSFYLGGQSQSALSINYGLTMTLNKASNDLEEAMRVMIIKNGVRRVYSKADENGNGKPIYKGDDHTEDPVEQIGTTIPFKENKHIIYEPYNVKHGEFDKYTIVMWIDGWESVNQMKGGVFQADIKFSTISKN